MKLHLPKALFAAVIGCFGMVNGAWGAELYWATDTGAAHIAGNWRYEDARGSLVSGFPSGDYTANVGGNCANNIHVDTVNADKRINIQWSTDGSAHSEGLGLSHLIVVGTTEDKEVADHELMISTNAVASPRCIIFNADAAGTAGISTDSNVTLSPANYIRLNATSTTFDVVSGKTITVSNLFKMGNGTLAVQGGGTVTVSGNIENLGTITVGSGTNLNLNGSTITAAGLGALDDKSATFSEASGNGYAGGEYWVVKNNGGAVSMTATQLSISGTSYALTEDEATHGYYITLAGTGGRYYVNSEVVYGDAGNASAAEETTGIVINGGNLVLNSSFTKEGNGYISVVKDGTITLNTPPPAEGEAAVPTVLNKSSVAAVATVSLAGNGVYDLGNSLPLGDNVALDSSWTGTVRFSGMDFANGVNTNRFGLINNLGNSSSWVEMSSSTGYLYSADGNGSVTVSANIIMAGETALAVNNGNSDCHATFNGDITGTGAFTLTLTGKTGPQGLGFTFNGNTSGWTGNIVTNTVNGSTLRVSKIAFNGTSSVSNKEIKSEAGLVELTIGGDSTQADGDIPAITSKNIDSKIYGDGSIALVTTGTLAKVFTKTVEVADVSISYNNGGTKTVEHSALELSGGAVTFKEDVTVHGDAKVNTTVTANKGLSIDAAKAITVGSATGNSLTHDGVTYSNGAVITNNGTKSTGVSVYDENFSIAGGAVEISGSTKRPVGDRNVNAIFDDSAVTFTGSGKFALGGTQNMASLTATSDTATFLVTGDSTIGTLSGFKGITIGDGKTLTTTTTTLADGTVTLNGEASFTSSNETVVVKEGASSATIAGTGAVSVGTSTLTYTNALIDVTQAGTVAIAATLANSKVTNASTDGSVVTVDTSNWTAETPNSVDASKGDITLSNATDVTVKDIAVSAGKTVTVGDGTGTATIKEGATVSGTIAGNVVVQGDTAETSSTFKAESGAKVTGNLTVNSNGKIELTTVNDNALQVAQTLTATTADIVLSDSLKTTINAGIAALNDTNTRVSFVLAKAQKLNVTGILADLGLGDAPANVTLTLTAGGSPIVVMAGDGDLSDLTLTADYVDPGTTPTPGPSVLNGAFVGFAEGTPGTLTLKLDKNLADLADMTTLNITVGAEAFAAIEQAGNIYSYANVALKDADNAIVDLTGLTVVLNGYVGETSGEHTGEYFVAYIPEPTTGTLSVLALAALALRRRRK